MLARRFAGPVVTGERRVEAASRGLRALRRSTPSCSTTASSTAPWRATPTWCCWRTITPHAASCPRARDASRSRRWRARVPCWSSATTSRPGRRSCAAPALPRPPRRHRAGRAAPGTRRGSPRLAGARVVAVAGVARPDRFAATLEACGARVVDRLLFPDHHDYYGRRRRRHPHGRAARATLVTTEKDLVKLAGAARPRAPAGAARRARGRRRRPAGGPARRSRVAAGRVAFPGVCG